MAHPAIDIAGVAIALSACVGTCVAAFVNWHTLRTVLEPEVVVYPEPDEKAPDLIQLVIQNVGKGGAHNIRFYPERPIPAKNFTMAPTKKFMDRGPFDGGIIYLPAGGRRVIDWGFYPSLAPVMATPIRVEVHCYQRKFSGASQLIRSHSVLEIQSFAGTTAARRRERVEVISEDLSKINETLNILAKKMGV